MIERSAWMAHSHDILGPNGLSFDFAVAFRDQDLWRSQRRCLAIGNRAAPVAAHGVGPGGYAPSSAGVPTPS